MSTDRQIAQTIETIFGALVQFTADMDDEDDVPIGRMLHELDSLMGVNVDHIDVGWTMTAGEIRANARYGFARLAAGETP